MNLLKNLEIKISKDHTVKNKKHIENKEKDIQKLSKGLEKLKGKTIRFNL